MNPILRTGIKQAEQLPLGKKIKKAHTNSNFLMFLTQTCALTSVSMLAVTILTHQRVRKKEFNSRDTREARSHQCDKYHRFRIKQLLAAHICSTAQCSPVLSIRGITSFMFRSRGEMH